MMSIILSLILCLLFIIFAVFHFYWFFGGVWGLKKVIPIKEINAGKLAIPKFATLIVAIIFVGFGWLYLIKSGMVSTKLSTNILNYSYWFVPSMFIIRAIGEFNYVGFFKKIKHTEFAISDSKIFSPLCLSMGIIGILIQIMSI